MTPPTFGVCACGHGEAAHYLRDDQTTRTYCSLYRCGCRRYDEHERYRLELVRTPADELIDEIGDPM